MNRVILQLEYFPHPETGKPVVGGNIYIGDPHSDPEILLNQIQVYAYTGSAQLIPMTQPIKTSGGGMPLYDGNPVALVVIENRFAMKVTDSNGDQLYYVDDSAASGGTGGHIIADEGTELASRTVLNFIGTGVEVEDVPGFDRTDVFIGGGDTATWGSITGTMAEQNDLNNALTAKYDKTDYIDESGGTIDANKPIVTNSNGHVDLSMIPISGSLEYQGSFTPTLGDEYPDNTGVDSGGYWAATGLPDEGYDMTTGDLAGRNVTDNDIFITSTTGWGLIDINLSPSSYYLLNGDYAITAPFNGGGQQFKNAAPATAPGDLVTLSQIGDDGGGGGTWGSILGSLPDQIDLWNELQDRYAKGDFLDESVGIADAGKPIKLSPYGKISLQLLDISGSIELIGNFTPTAGNEYPNADLYEPGAYWIVNNLPINGYTFTGGDLAGEQIFNADMMLIGSVRWSMIRSKIEPTSVYLLDGSASIIAPFAGGGQRFTNCAAGSNSSDLATVGQIPSLAPGFPSNTKMVFYQSSPPSGWTLFTSSATNDSMLRIVNSGGGGVGGSDSPILMNKVPSHTHNNQNTISGTGLHTHPIPTGITGSAGFASIQRSNTPTSESSMLTGADNNHVHQMNVGANDSASNWTPKYTSMIICNKT